MFGSKRRKQRRTLKAGQEEIVAKLEDAVGALKQAMADAGEVAASVRKDLEKRRRRRG